jgi:hypothetical protein
MDFRSPLTFQEPRTPHSGPPALDGDAAVRATDGDASGSRLSAVRKAYIDDPFIQHFIPARARGQGAQERPPLINVGTSIRGEGVDRLIASWLMIGDGVKQVVSLGAGSDTRFWRFMQVNRNIQRLLSFSYRSDPASELQNLKVRRG